MRAIVKSKDATPSHRTTRASAGVGTSLPPEGAAAFDRDLQSLLAEKFPEEPLAVLHRVFAAIGKASE